MGAMDPAGQAKHESASMAPVAPEQAVQEQPAPDEMAALRPAQVAPAQDYNAYIASQESGADPNVGYHYPANAQGQRKSTAYGTYGITAPAYRDIQMADPYFRGKPITALTPEDQARANSIGSRAHRRKYSWRSITGCWWIKTLLGHRHV